MCMSSELKTDWKQFPALVICVLDYPQFYWKTLYEFGDYTGLVLVLYLFSFPYTVSNTMTCHMEEQSFLQLNPIQKLLTQNCQTQWDEKEEMLTIWQIHYNLRPILHVSLNTNMSTQRGKYNRSWLCLPSVIGRGTQQALVFWMTVGPEKSTHQDTHSATYYLLEIIVIPVWEYGFWGFKKGIQNYLQHWPTFLFRKRRNCKDQRKREEIIEAERGQSEEAKEQAKPNSWVQQEECWFMKEANVCKINVLCTDVSHKSTLFEGGVVQMKAFLWIDRKWPCSW